MKKADYIVYGEYVLPMDETLGVLKDTALAISNGKIIEIGAFKEISRKYETKSLIGGSGRAILPGLINTHTHAAMVLLRGMADDLPLKQWLEGHIWPAENKWLGTEFINDAVELACIEMLKAGITTYNDMYFFEDVAAETTKRLGMRAVLGAGILDFPTKTTSGAEDCLEKAERFIDKWKEDELITPCVAPHAVYTCSAETLRKAKAIAIRHNVPVHIHLSETEWEVYEIKNKYGKTPGMLLNEIDFLSERVLAAHCVWLTDEEIDILAEKNVSVSHCIESNLKLASGIAPVLKMLRAGIKVTFGTDGAASNNDLNILGEMSTAAKVHKAVSKDPTALEAKTVLLMATRWAAEALRLQDVGSLEPGKTADIIIINLEKPHLTPLYNIYSHIVYSMRPSDVESVMVNGKMVLNDGKLLNADEKEILKKAKNWGERITNG
jgi:5-methylthioadenosine/S-adenosylhomocysteine deaminase